MKIAVMIICVGVILLFRNARNAAVYRYRMSLLNRVSIEAKKDIAHHLPWEWHYHMLESVSYDRMLYLVWTSLDSFYPDKSFIEPTPILEEPK